MINGTLTEKDLLEFLYNIFSKKVDGTLTLLDEYNSKGKNIYNIIDELIYFCKEALIYKVSEAKRQTLVRYENYSKIDSLSTETDLYNLIHDMNELKLTIKDSNNIKVLFEVELIKIMSELNKKNISQEIINVQNNNSKSVINDDSPKKQLQKNKNIVLDEDFDQLKNIRINNTLARLDKKNMLELKNKKESFRFYLLDNNYGQCAALLLDGIIKAASDEYIIYVYDNESDVLDFNANLDKIESLIYKSIKSKYKVIAVSSSEWDVIKNEFNAKKKEYIYTEESKKPQKKTSAAPVSAIDGLFDNIVEYVEEEIK
jgi:DNA polymerase III gamma/tau subunit